MPHPKVINKLDNSEYQKNQTNTPKEQDEIGPTVVTPPEKVPGLRDYKNMMRQFFTVRRQTVKDCGHKYNETSEPRTNCHICWFAWLNAHGDMIKICDEMFVQPGGEAALVKIKGIKFVKNFKKFMSTLARWKAEEAVKKGLLNVGTESAAGECSQQGEPVQEPTGVGEDSQRETEDNNVAG